MQKWISNLLLFSLLALCFSCIKKNDTPPTVLAIHCLDSVGNPVPGAYVAVYNDSTDLLNNINVAYSGNTDAKGNISFSGVKAQQYYFLSRNHSCLVNWGAQKTKGALEANKTNNLDVVLTGYGTLIVSNISKNPYEVKIDSTVWIPSLAAGATMSKIRPLRICTVEVIQLSGYTTSPIDNIYPINIQQCATEIQDVPQ